MESKDKLAEMKQKALDNHFTFTETICARGEPSKQICKYAIDHKIDTIVMGRRGMGMMKRFVIRLWLRDRIMGGSVSEYVITNAPCA